MQIFVKVRHHANYHTRARRLTAPAQGGSGGGGTQRGQPRAAHAGSAAIGALPCLRAALGGQQFKHVHGGGRCSAPAVDSNRWAGCGSGGPRHRDASVSAARSLLLDPSRQRQMTCLPWAKGRGGAAETVLP